MGLPIVSYTWVCGTGQCTRGNRILHAAQMQALLFLCVRAGVTRCKAWL